MGFKIYFGGPEHPPRLLSTLLSERIAAVPRGGEIDWVTYYFRDRLLAEALIDARWRGVRVRLTLEGAPRTHDANNRVLALLRGPKGLGEDLRLVSHSPVAGTRWKPHLHEKLYCFSHPVSCALVGSFNPSGDKPEEDPHIIREILDQDRGHNFLVEIDDPVLVAGLVAHARYVHDCRHGPLERFSKPLNLPLTSGSTEIHFWPRASTNPISRLLRRFGPDAWVRVAASHVKGPGVTRDLIQLAARGGTVEILAESTHRRVPAEVASQLVDAGIRLSRFQHPEGLPMHNKFILIEYGDQRWSVFGSCNWTTRSRWLNHEIAVISPDAALFETFSGCWDTMHRQAV